MAVSLNPVKLVKQFGAKRKRDQRKMIFKALFVGLGMVMFWRGSWSVADLLIFPNHPEMSALTSLAVGLTILYFSNKIIDSFM